MGGRATAQTSESIDLRRLFIKTHGKMNGLEVLKRPVNPVEGKWFYRPGIEFRTHPLNVHGQCLAKS
jgi:hypothetical protein